MNISSALIILAILGGCAGSAVVAQSEIKKERFYVDPRRPSVFLDVVASPISSGIGKNSSDQNKKVLLKLSNNLKWDIRVSATGAKAGEGDALLEYDVIDRLGQSVGGFSCHVCSFRTVPSGTSVVFAVSQKDALSGSKIRVRFTYAWENAVDSQLGVEPFHYVLMEIPFKS